MFNYYIDRMRIGHQLQWCGVGGVINVKYKY